MLLPNVSESKNLDRFTTSRCSENPILDRYPIPKIKKHQRSTQRYRRRSQQVVLLCLGLWMHCSSAAMIVVPSRLVKCLPVIEETARLKRIIEMVRSTHQIESGVDQIDIDRVEFESSIWTISIFFRSIISRSPRMWTLGALSSNVFDKVLHNFVFLGVGRREWPIGGALDDSASPADRRDVEETTLRLLLHTNIHHHSLTIFHT